MFQIDGREREVRSKDSSPSHASGVEARLSTTTMQRITGVILLAVATGSCSDSGDGDDRDPDLYEDPRTMTEMCEKWCANAEANGCPDISGSSCMPTCTFVPLTFMGDCLTLYKNHTGCLADVPNVCDGELRDELCFDEYCAMRHECELPDSRCD